MAVTKNTSQRGLIISTITLIYVFSVLQLAIQWWGTVWQFIENGATRNTSFLAYFSAPAWVVVINGITTPIVVILADGLLVSYDSIPLRRYHAYTDDLIAVVVALFPCLGRFQAYNGRTGVAVDSRDR